LAAWQYHEGINGVENESAPLVSEAVGNPELN